MHSHFLYFRIYRKYSTKSDLSTTRHYYQRNHLNSGYCGNQIAVPCECFHYHPHLEILSSCIVNLRTGTDSPFFSRILLKQEDMHVELFIAKNQVQHSKGTE